jgi:hypothetical protein
VRPTPWHSLTQNSTPKKGEILKGLRDYLPDYKAAQMAGIDRRLAGEWRGTGWVGGEAVNQVTTLPTAKNRTLFLECARLQPQWRVATA